MALDYDRTGSKRPEEWPDERAACAEDEWLDRCLDEGTVLHCRIAASGTEADDDRVEWLVPDRDGHGYHVVTGAPPRDDLIGIVLLDE